MSGRRISDKNEVTFNEFSIESIDDISSSSINLSTGIQKGRGGSVNNILPSSKSNKNKDLNSELVIDLTEDSTGNFNDSDEDDINLINSKTRRVRRNIFDSEDGDYSKNIPKNDNNNDKKRRNSSQPPQLKRANSSGLGTIDVREIVKSISANSSPKKQKTKANSLDFLSSFTVNSSKNLKSNLNSNIDRNSNTKNHLYEDSYESIPWTTKYSPQKSSEVFLHPSKIKDVRNKISDMINRRCKSRLLVLSGPSGSGKSTLARLLADELIQEKLNSNKYEYSSSGNNKNKMMNLEIGDVEVKEEDTSTKSDNVIEYKLFSTSTSKLTSPVTNFGEFLDQCKFLKNKCVLIEELPNLYHLDTLKNFQASISNWLELSKVLEDFPVLIVCITDVEIDGYDSFTSNGNGLSSSFGIERNFITETIMGPKLMEMENRDYIKGCWSHIKFNPVAKLYMKKILNTIVKNETSVIKRIPATIFNFKFNNVFIKNGDIRNSINNLEYWCKFFYDSKYDSEYYNEIENFGDGSGTNNKNNNINAIGKEVNLDLFHSIGKILYGTQHVEEEIESFLKSNNNHSLVSNESGNLDYVKSINFIISSNVTRDIISQFNIFNLNIIENYCNLNSMQFPIDNYLTDLIDNVSLSDVLSSIGDSINSTNLGISNNNNNFNNKLRNSNFRTTTNLISEESALISVFGSRLNLNNISKKIEFLVNENKINKNKNLNLKYSRDSKIRRKNNSLYLEIKNYKLNRLNNLLLSKNSNNSNNDGLNNVTVNSYSYLSDTDCMLYDGFYESNILNSRKFRMKFNSRISNNSYNIPRVERLGGGFENLVLADNKLKLIDEDIEESKENKLEVPILSLNGIKKTINNNHRKISANDLQKYEDYYFLGFSNEVSGGITGDNDRDVDDSDSSEFDLDPIMNSDDDESYSKEVFKSDDDFSDSDEELLDL